MEEDNLFGEIDDFLNTTTHAYNDTNPNNGGPPPPAPSHQIVQVRIVRSCVKKWTNKK